MRNCTLPNDVYTGHPWIEYLNMPREMFKDPWKTSKKRILICPHHTVRGLNQYGNHSGLMQYAEMLLEAVKRYGDEVEFVMRPHPKFMKHYYRKRYAGTPVQELVESVTISTDADYVGWFKHSDALIHDCGSFRCEYLHMDRPVMYMANAENMNSNIWSEMGSDAMKCHELCWYEKEGETLDDFIQKVIQNEDSRREIRHDYLERHHLTQSTYPNGKTPSENIIDALLGTGAYENVHLWRPAPVSEVKRFRRNWKSNKGLQDLVEFVQHDSIVKNDDDEKKLTVVEIGSFQGESAELMLNTGKVGRIYCVDPWKDGYSYFYKKDKHEINNFNLVEQAFDMKFRYDERVVKHKGDIDSFLAQFGDELRGKIDLVYIDGLHTYEGVAHDIEMAEKLNPKYISGHDYDRNVDFGGPMKAVDEKFGKPDKTFLDTSWIVKMGKSDT